MSWRTIQNLRQLGVTEGGLLNGKPYLCLASGRYWDFEAGRVVGQIGGGASVSSTSPSSGGIDVTGKKGVLHVSKNTLLGNATTDELPEGDNLYFTETRAAIAGYGASAVGTDAYAITVTGIAALVIGDRFRVLADVGNTGAATLQVNSLPSVAAAIVKQHDVALATGDIEAGQMFEVVWDGTSYQMQSQLALLDHNALTNLVTGDPHTLYALLAGRAGGQSLSGGDAANDDLTLQGTTNATRTTSYLLLQPNGGLVGIGGTPSFLLDVVGTSISTHIANFAGTGVNGGVIRFQAKDSTGYSGMNVYNNSGALAASFAYGNASVAGGYFANQFIFASRMASTAMCFYQGGALASNLRLTFDASGNIVFNTGNVGIGNVTPPTARLHLPAGTATASTAPLKLTTGVSNTSAEAGAVEFTTDDLFFVITTGTARKRILFADPVGGLTSGRIPVATTNGRLTDVAGMTSDQMVTFYGVSAAGNDTYAITPAPALGAYAAGVKVLLKADVANTGACSVNVSALGAVNIKTRAGADPGDGDLPAGSITLLVHDGTNFQIV